MARSGKLALALFAALVSSTLHASPDGPLLLRRPALGKNDVAFSYAGDLWLVDRKGGDARRHSGDTRSAATCSKAEPDDRHSTPLRCAAASAKFSNLERDGICSSERWTSRIGRRTFSSPLY